MSKPLRLGIAGLGTVGVGVVKILQAHGDLLAQRCGRRIEITAISARDASKDRGVDLSPYVWVEDALDLAGRDDVDVVIELIGGSEGVAKDLVEKALATGQHVVTANKALLAHHGAALAQLAEDNNVALAYEAAVAGGIPIIKVMREGFAGNAIHAVYGILNGTCNYMLTAMRETGRDFDVILKEAQEAGYAEADPSFDIDGIDAGHKLALLSAIAFGVKPDFESLQIEGIRKINATDIRLAEEFGYRIKLLGIARRFNGSVMQVMEPCLVPLSNPIAQIEDVYNAVYVDCDSVETSMLSGKGAGEGPTASAVLSDVMDLARGNILPTFGVPAQSLLDPRWADIGDTVSCYYLRLCVLDKPGVIAEISTILRDHDISIEGLSQHGRDPDQPVSVVLTTHETRRRDMQKACSEFANLDSVLEEPCLMRIEALS
ncbi:MAG: homoserine dehydrogenase [Rhodospirillales bacterium]|nr:homoserine dehydrogenase [Alphaproteobacteria bacterium]MCB9980801.1 homoserine dehydrogenase [Rhodospirillales bacterium]